MIPFSSFSAFAEALTYFLPCFLVWCLLGAMSFFVDFWILCGVDKSFRRKILFSAVWTVCLVPSTNFRLFLIFPILRFSQISLFKKRKRIFKFSTNRLHQPPLLWLVRRTTKNLSFSCHDYVVCHLSFFILLRRSGNRRQFSRKSL